MSHSELWQSVYQSPKSPRRLWIAGIAVLVVMLTLLPVFYAAEHLGGAFVGTLPPLQSPEVVEAHDRDLWLQDVLNAQQVKPGWEPPVAKATSPSIAPRPRTKPTPASARPKNHPTVVIPQLISDEADPFYSALFGSKDRFAASSLHASTPGAHPTAPSSVSDPLRGATWSAYLRDTVAASPSGAPVIAVLDRPVDLGAKRVPAGAEIHGVVAGPSGDGTRMYIDFAFLRLRDGKTLSIQGVARDESGRLGIAGKRIHSSATASIVGLAAATRAVSAAGRVLAGRAGSIVGEGIDGATDAGTDRAQRSDQDEYILLADRGARFTLYLTGDNLDRPIP